MPTLEKTYYVKPEQSNAWGQRRRRRSRRRTRPAAAICRTLAAEALMRSTPREADAGAGLDARCRPRASGRARLAAALLAASRLAARAGLGLASGLGALLRAAGRPRPAAPSGPVSLERSAGVLRRPARPACCRGLRRGGGSAAMATTVPVTATVPATPAAMLSCSGLFGDAAETRQRVTGDGAWTTGVLSHAYEVSCRVRAGDARPPRSDRCGFTPRTPEGPRIVGPPLLPGVVSYGLRARGRIRRPLRARRSRRAGRAREATGGAADPFKPGIFWRVGRLSITGLRTRVPFSARRGSRQPAQSPVPPSTLTASTPCVGQERGRLRAAPPTAQTR